MKFGRLAHPELIDYQLPVTHPQSFNVLGGSPSGDLQVFIGCAKWNRKDLVNFYPRRTRDDLQYYSRQFNGIEFNASFYRMFPERQFLSWKNRTSDNFRFYPKVPRLISHLKRLKETEILVDDFVTNILALDKKLGMPFMQLREDFGGKNFNRLETFFKHWPVEIPLAVELRHPEWFSDPILNEEVNLLMRNFNITHVLTDTPGRRDVLHMKLTTTTALIRFNAVKASLDRRRIDEWSLRLKEWKENGLKELCFFVHEIQDENEGLVSTYLAKELNRTLQTDLIIPKTLN